MIVDEWEVQNMEMKENHVCPRICDIVECVRHGITMIGVGVNWREGSG